MIGYRIVFRFRIGFRFQYVRTEFSFQESVFVVGGGTPRHVTEDDKTSSGSRGSEL